MLKGRKGNYTWTLFPLLGEFPFLEARDEHESSPEGFCVLLYLGQWWQWRTVHKHSLIHNFWCWFRNKKLLKWWFLCVFEIMWAPPALKLHLYPCVPVHVQWSSGFMERSLWRSLINVSELNWRNTSKKVDIVLIFLLPDKLALTLCITASPHLLMRSFRFLNV